MCWVLTLWVHSGVQHSSRSMQSHQSCTLFFWIVQSSGRSFLSISSSGLCFGSGGGVFLTFTHLVSSASAIHAKVVGESASAFLGGEFAVLSEFIGEVGLLVLSGGTGQVRIGPLVRRRRGGFVVGGLIFLTKMLWNWWTCWTSVHQTCYRTSWIPGKFQTDVPSSAHQFAESIGAFQRG